MKRTAIAACLALLALAPVSAFARGPGVEVWTDRGNDAVYEPGDRMQIKVRASDDAYMLVYEIDSEGYVRVLFPYRGANAMVEGRRTYRVPSEDADVDLVVENPVGQGYVVALASVEGFREMPWYLRPYDPSAEANGYVGAPEEEEGITAEGRIVGDPFVAMERIRRRVLENAEDRESFATDYTTYYVHQQVRYPRYICYDCHRPNRYAFWDGFDPYYTHCSAFDFRVNWSWCWGPSYWFGRVPYFVYVYRDDCPPRYRNGYGTGVWYSSWDGWRRWNDLWGQGGLRRYKSPPPTAYVPPSKYRVADRLGPGLPTPPGFMTRDGSRGVGARVRPALPLGHGGRDDVGTREGGGMRTPNGEGPRERPAERPADRGGWNRPAPGRSPAVREPRGEDRRDRDPAPRPQRGDERPAPSYNPPREPAPRGEAHPPREEPRGRVDRPAPPPREEKSPPPPSREKPPPSPGGRGDGGGGRGKVTRP